MCSSDSSSPRIALPTTFVSRSTTLSSPSTSVSSTIGTSTLRVISPSVNCTMLLTIWKSSTASAVPFVAVRKATVVSPMFAPSRSTWIRANPLLASSLML